MSKIINYIPLKNILADYELMMSDLAQVGEDTVLQWASDALDKLNIGRTLDYQVALLDVFNYTAMQPHVQLIRHYLLLMVQMHHRLHLGLDTVE